MARQVVSRTQRRMEKKQALVLLVLVLAVSLVSFTLGVMVGRSSSSPEIAKAPPTVPPRVPVSREASPAGGEEATKPAREMLTFYDSLPKGEPSPLGSGINLPPRNVGVEKDPAVKVDTPAKKDSGQPEKAASDSGGVAESPPAAADGKYAVQVASFRGVEDARKLEQRLAGKDYVVFVEAADLKEKGVWHRVFVGPFADSEGAGKILARLKAEEKLDGLVRKR